MNTKKFSKSDENLKIVIYFNSQSLKVDSLEFEIINSHYNQYNKHGFALLSHT